jgi:hypothetical protein
MEGPVVTAAQIAFSVRLKDSSDVSENTKNAQAIAKAWRGTVHTLDPGRFQIEALVTPELDQKIAVRLAGRRPCHGRESRAFGARPQACREERQDAGARGG